jgi:hypothetical protein
MNTQKTIYAGVLQDKATLPRTYKASGEPSYSSPPAQLRPVTPDLSPTQVKHHGSQKRQLREVSGCITNNAFQRLEVMRNAGKKNEVSRSSVVGKFVTQGIQQNADMQYISMLEPIIEKVIERKIDSYANRTAFLSVLGCCTSEEGNLKLDILLRSILKPDDLHDLQAKVKEKARVNISQRMGEEKKDK